MREKRAFEGLSSYNGEIKVNNELYRGLARSFGMAECAFWVLYTLRMERDGLTLHDLCACLYQSKQTIHSALKQLARDGAVRFEPGADRRSKRVCLTPGGVALAETTVDHVIDAEVRAMMALGEPELERFLHLFRTYNQALKREFGETK